MAFDSNFSSVHSLQGPAMYCADKSCWMVSLCSGSMFVHVWVRDVRKQDGGAGDREALPIVRRSWQLGQKVWRLSLSYSISWGKMPSHWGNIFGKLCLDTKPNRKRCFCVSWPRGVEIIHEKALALCWVGAEASEAFKRLVWGWGYTDEFVGWGASAV